MPTDDEFLSEMESGAIAAAEQLGIKLTTVDAQNDQSKLLQFVETAKNDGQKVIVVNPVDCGGGCLPSRSWTRPVI